MVRLSRVTLLIAEPGADKSEVLRSAVMPLLSKRGRGAEAEIAVVFDEWNEPPLPALHACVRQAAASAGAAVSEPGADSLLGNLREWQEALDVTFIIVFDRFEQFLAAPAGRTGIAEFEEAFVQIANDPMLRANFLLAFDEEAEPLLARLKRHIPRLGNSRVRLPRMRHAAEVASTEPPAGARARAVHAAPAARAKTPAPPADATPAVRHGPPASASSPSSVPPIPEPRAERESSAVAQATSPHIDERAPDAESPRAPAVASSDTRAEERPDPVLRGGTFGQRLRRIGWAPLLLIPAAWFLFGQPKPTDPGARDEAPPRDETAGSKDGTPVASPRAEKSAGEKAALRAPAPATEAASPTPAQSASPDPPPRAEVAAPKPPPPPLPAPRAEVAPPKAPVVPPPPPQAEVAPPKAPAPSRVEAAPPKVAAPPTAPRVEAAPPKVAAAPTAPRVEAAPPQPVVTPAPPRAGVPPGKPPPTTAPSLAPRPDGSAEKAPAPPPPVASAAAKPAAPPPVTGAAVKPTPQPEVLANAPASAPAVPSARAPAGPVLHILVRNEAQRTRAQQLIGPLKERGIHVARVRIVPPSPDAAHIRYYRLNDRNEAMRVAFALRELGLNAQQLKQMPEPDTAGPGRTYELWLP